MTGTKILFRRYRKQNVAAGNVPRCVNKKFVESNARKHINGAQNKLLIDAIQENRSQSDSSTDEETLESSTCINNGFLIVPIPRRQDAFVPPKSMFDGVPKRRKSKSMTKLLGWNTRSQSTKSSVSSSRTVQSPYISKSSFNNLSPSLRSSGQMSGSAWQKPTSSIIPLRSSINDEESTQHVTPPSVVEMNVPLSTSDSFTLPIVISPAFKFVPIGYSSDADDCCSFHSSDYDVCKSNSDLDSSNRYSEDVKKSQANSSAAADASDVNEDHAAQNTEKPNDMKEATKSEVDLTPFELDHGMSSQSRDDSIDKFESSESDIKLSKTRSSSSLVIISREFSIVSLYDAEPTKSQSSDNEDCRQNSQTQARLGDFWFLWEQVTSLVYCGAHSTY